VVRSRWPFKFWWAPTISLERLIVSGAVNLSPVHTSNNVEATLSNATSWTILSTMSNVASTLLPFLATMLPVFGNNVKRNFVLPTKSKQIEHVERTKFYNRIDRHCCRLWQQSWILLRHCCWCGRVASECHKLFHGRRQLLMTPTVEICIAATGRVEGMVWLPYDARRSRRNCLIIMWCDMELTCLSHIIAQVSWR